MCPPVAACTRVNDECRGDVPASMDTQLKQGAAAVTKVERFDHHLVGDNRRCDGHHASSAHDSPQPQPQPQPACQPYADAAISDTSVRSHGLLRENTHRERLRRALRERREGLHDSHSETPRARRQECMTEWMPSMPRDRRRVSVRTCGHDNDADDGDDDAGARARAVAGAADDDEYDDDNGSGGGGDDDDDETNENTDEIRRPNSVGHSVDDRALDQSGINTTVPLGTSSDTGRVADDEDNITVFGTLPPELVDRVFGALHPDELCIAAQTCSDFAR